MDPRISRSRQPGVSPATLDPQWLICHRWLASGVGPDSVGPIIIDESLWPEVGHFPWAYWTIVPDHTRIRAHELDAILAAWPRFGDAILGTNTGASGFSQDGQFLLTADAKNSRVRAVDALTPMVPLTLAVIALVSMLELARLLAEIRSTETELMWSRGASSAGLAGSTAIEAAIAAALGALIGTTGAAAVLAGTAGPEAIGAAGQALWIIPIAATAMATLIFAVQAFRASRLSARRDVPGEIGPRGPHCPRRRRRACRHRDRCSGPAIAVVRVAAHSVGTRR